MRRFQSLFTIVLVVALAGVAGVLAGEKAAGTTHEVTVQVVSVDASAKTITFKGEDGKEMTAPVMPSAAAGLDKVKAGEKYVLTCQDDAEGQHEGVTKIKPAKA